MKYIVMECRLSYAVVLDENGQFLKAANRNYEVGQTVTDIIPMAVPEPVKKKPTWVKQLGTLAACLVLVFTALFFYTQNTPYASVYIAINPEVRIDVNRSDAVLNIEGINQDGKDLLEGYEYSRKDLDTVTEELVDRAIDMGYLHEGGKITLTLDAEKKWVVNHEEKLNNRLNDHLTDRIQVTINVGHSHREEDSPYTDYDPMQIPVTPGQTTRPNDGQTDYGPTDTSSDYDDTDYGTTEPVTTQPKPTEPKPTQPKPTEPKPTQPSDSDYGDTDYGTTEPDDGTDYDPTEPDDGTDYDPTEPEEQTDYDPTEPEEETDYDPSEPEEQTDYGSDEDEDEDEDDEDEEDEDEDEDDDEDEED